MAKAGFWLRGAKGKLAGASMGKGANGQTIMREIVTPKNPRTNAQLMQRAIMATVMQAYSAGKIIFDHSFQGRSVGAPNQQRFMSLNARRLRSTIMNDIDGNVTVNLQKGRVVAPGVPSPTPAILQVSEGTLNNTLLPNSKWTAGLANETLAQYCSRLGLTANDLFTFVALYIDGNNKITMFSLEGDDTEQSKQYATQFVWARFKVKASAFTSDSLVTASGLEDILELSEGNFNPTLDAEPNQTVGVNEMISNEALGTSAWIRSRVDEDLRSTEIMVGLAQPYGIVSSFALAAWKQGAGNLGDSELILEGGDL